jgi:hypothetical protein
MATFNAFEKSNRRILGAYVPGGFAEGCHNKHRKTIFENSEPQDATNNFP